MDKHQILVHLAAARVGLLAAIEGLGRPQTTTLPISGVWTVREILAHISGWAAWDLTKIEEIQQGNHPDLSIIQDVDAFNEQLVAERSGWSLDQILAEMQDTHAAVQELVASMPDRDLLEPGRFQGPYWDSLAGWLQVAWEHEETHADQIRGMRREKVVRPARLDDVEAIAQVQVDTWRTSYPGIVPDERLANLDYARSAEKWRQILTSESETRLFVAEVKYEQVVGFACGGPLRTLVPGFDGELYAIYVLKAHQSQGLGRALVAAVADNLSMRGFKSMVIWVLKDNPRRGFYEALGGQVVGETEIEISGVRLAEVGYGWLEWSHLNVS